MLVYGDGDADTVSIVGVFVVGDIVCVIGFCLNESHKNDDDKLQYDGTQRLAEDRMCIFTHVRLLEVLLFRSSANGVSQFGVKASFNVAPDVYTHLSSLFVFFNPIQHSGMGDIEHNHSACNCCDFVWIVAR